MTSIKSQTIYHALEIMTLHNSTKYGKAFSPSDSEHRGVNVFLGLEGYPVFLMVLFVGGLQRPKTCASAGWVWILGQVAYVYGYCSDDKTNRRYGKRIGYLGLLTMFGCTIEFGVRELMHKRLFHTAVGVKNVMTTKAKGLLPSVLKKQDR